MLYIFYNNLDNRKNVILHPYSPVWRGERQPPQGRKLNNINNMPDRRYLPSINFAVPFAR
jgi:hypothetical protein